MKSKVVAILETRTGEHSGRLIARRGGIPMLAPALEEVPDVDPQAVAALLAQWRVDPFKIVIFQTGVGTRALFQATDAAGLTAELTALLNAATVVVRGPKPVGELNAREVRIDMRAATPFTTETVLAAVSELPMQGAAGSGAALWRGKSTAARDFGRAGRRVWRRSPLTAGRLPADTRPLNRLLEALARSGVDAVVFTSAVQIHNLYAHCAEKTRRDVRTRESAESAGRRVHRPGVLAGAAGTRHQAVVRSQSAETGAAGRRPRGGFVGGSLTVIGRVG